MDIPDGEYVTLGGLLFDQFGHIPLEGEEIRVGDWDLRVIEMDKRRVAQVVATYAGEGDGPPPSAPENGQARHPRAPPPRPRRRGSRRAEPG